ncbi:MAG: methyltransferase domain-containing protein [Thiohalobacterales bacterium]|nr:methyltransferase domain-containing protein [Thiohalobacterales bacterium]
MERGYQHGFSEQGTAMFDVTERRRKARTMVAVLKEQLGTDLGSLSVLNVGGSAGIIDDYLARHFGRVTGIDIDEHAIRHAQENYSRDNLSFEIGDAMDLQYPDSTFDVVICSQVYEHVPDAETMMGEIYRVLKPGGVCYFAAGNRLMLNEPHYNLPLLSVIPRPLAHLYMKLARRGSHYYEKHLSYWGLKKLVRAFETIDYTRPIITTPDRFEAGYMIRPNTPKHRVAAFMARYLFWLVPGYIWILRKPAA